MKERNDLIKELFELHSLLADKGEIGIGYGFIKNYNRLKKQVKKLTLTDVGCQREQLITFLMKVGDCYGMEQRENAESCVDEIMSS